jgi:hypothetical protein
MHAGSFEQGDCVPPSRLECSFVLVKVVMIEITLKMGRVSLFGDSGGPWSLGLKSVVPGNFIGHRRFCHPIGYVGDFYRSSNVNVAPGSFASIVSSTLASHWWD